MMSDQENPLFSLLMPTKERCRKELLPWIREIAPGEIPPGSPEEKRFLQDGYVEPWLLEVIIRKIKTIDDSVHQMKILEQAIGHSLRIAA